MFVSLPVQTAAPVAYLPLETSQPQKAEAHLKPGGYLFYEGDDMEFLYQVTSGVLRLTRLLADGRRQVIAFGYPGDIIGFSSNGIHHTDCKALTDVRLQPFRRSALERGEGDRILHAAFLQAALREISSMQDHFMVLGRKSASEKLASFLCMLDERVGADLGAYRSVTLPMNRADIADFLALTTETVSRTFTQLRKSKIIAVNNNHTVIIQRPTALKGLARGDCR